MYEIKSIKQLSPYTFKIIDILYLKDERKLDVATCIMTHRMITIYKYNFYQHANAYNKRKKEK